jgi:hypothetical protein
VAQQRDELAQLASLAELAAPVAVPAPAAAPAAAPVVVPVDEGEVGALASWLLAQAGLPGAGGTPS